MTQTWISVGLRPPLGWRYALSLSGRYAPLPSGGAKLGKRQVIVKSNCKAIESCNERTRMWSQTWISVGLRPPLGWR